MELYYPNNANGTYPLVLFSHGAFGIKASNFSNYTNLASHGYVVVSIDHPYHSFYTASEDGRTAMIHSDYMREVNNANKEDIYTMEELYGLFQNWMELRTEDMNFVIDTILEKIKSDKDPIYQLINVEKTGVFGHSMKPTRHRCLTYILTMSGNSLRGTRLIWRTRSLIQISKMHILFIFKGPNI